MKFENYGVSIDMEQCSASIYGNLIQESRPTALYVSCLKNILETYPKLLGEREALFTVDAERAAKYAGSTKTIQIHGETVYINTGFNTQTKLKNLEKVAALADGFDTGIREKGQVRENIGNPIHREPIQQEKRKKPINPGIFQQEEGRKPVNPEPIQQEKRKKPINPGIFQQEKGRKPVNPEPSQQDNRKLENQAVFSDKEMIEAYLDLMNMELEEYVYGDGRLEKYIKSMPKEWQEVFIPESDSRSMVMLSHQLEHILGYYIASEEICAALSFHCCYWLNKGGKRELVNRVITKVPKMLETLQIMAGKGFVKAEFYHAVWRYGAGLIIWDKQGWQMIKPDSVKLMASCLKIQKKAPALVIETMYTALLNSFDQSEISMSETTEQQHKMLQTVIEGHVLSSYPCHSAGNYWNRPMVYSIDERKYNPFGLFQIIEKNHKVYYLEGKQTPHSYSGQLYCIHELDLNTGVDKVILKIEDDSCGWRGFPDISGSYRRVCHTRFPMFSLFGQCIYYTSNDTIYRANLQEKKIYKLKNSIGKNKIYAAPIKLQKGFIYIGKSSEYVLYYYTDNENIKISVCNEILAYNEREVYFTKGKKNTLMVFDSNDMQTRKISEVYQNIEKKQIIFVDAGKEIAYYLEDSNAVLGDSRLLGINKQGNLVDIWEKPKLLSQLKRVAKLDEGYTYHSIAFDGKHLIFATNGRFRLNYNGQELREKDFGPMFFSFDRAGNAETILQNHPSIDRIGGPFCITEHSITSLVHDNRTRDPEYSLGIFPFCNGKNNGMSEISVIAKEIR